MYLFRNRLLAEGNIVVALSKIAGMSWSRARIVVARSGVGLQCSMIDVNEYIFNTVSSLLRRIVIGEIRILRGVRVNINRLIDYKTYRGVRHKLCLPTRGQRTRTNAGTQKAKRLSISNLIAKRVGERTKKINKSNENSKRKKKG